MSEYVPLAGSLRGPMSGAKRIAMADPNRVVDITLVLRRRLPIRARQAPLVRMHRSLFGERFGADPRDIDDIRRFGESNGLRCKTINQPGRTIVLNGTIADVSRAFRTALALYESPLGVCRDWRGPLHIPLSLAPTIQAVLGLDDRPVAKPHFVKAADYPGQVPFLPRDVGALYDFPYRYDGSGQRVAIVELGGGYSVADLNAYFGAQGLSSPLLTDFSVDGGHNSPGDDSDAEVMLDIEVLHSIAPGAEIGMYFAPNTESSFLNAMTTAVHDEVFRPTIVSLSWGAPEQYHSDQMKTAMEGVFIDAAALGVTICIASGDSGSSGGADGVNVDFPASCPHALACGGTRLNVTRPGVIDSETVWNDDLGASGGGVSAFFPLPTWQVGAGVPLSKDSSATSGRGVPDVAGDADPDTGYSILLHGKHQVYGGTSAVAPLWAGLIALINGYLNGPTVGFLHPIIYLDWLTRIDFRDVTMGNNGAYSAAPAWDACTGWGSPDGSRVLNSVADWYFSQLQMAYL